MKGTFCTQCIQCGQNDQGEEGEHLQVDVKLTLDCPWSLKEIYVSFALMIKLLLLLKCTFSCVASILCLDMVLCILNCLLLKYVY